MLCYRFNKLHNDNLFFNVYKYIRITCELHTSIIAAYFALKGANVYHQVWHND